MSNWKYKQLLGLMFLIGAIVFVPHFTTDVKAAGELRVGWQADTMVRSLACNNSWQYEDMGMMWWQLVYDQPWHFDSPPDYKCSLRAITGSETNDNQTFKFFIREGMTFHDGKPVTAKDFAFTMEHLPVSNPVWAFYDAVTVPGSISVIDDHTVQFTLKQPIAPKYPPFNWFPILPEHLWRRNKFDIEKYDNKKAIGSGPFKLKEYQAGLYMSFENFEDYWEKKPRVDTVVFKTFGSTDGLNMALKKGEIDMIGLGGVSPMAVKYLEKIPDIKIDNIPGLRLSCLTFNLYDKERATSDLNFRKAFVHAIDKKRIIDMVHHGYAHEQLSSFLYPELYEYNPNLIEYEYNVELANKILDDSGYIDTDGDGIRNEIAGKRNNMSYKFLVSSDSVEEIKTVQLIREQMKAIGVDLRIVATDYDTYEDTLYYPQGMGFDIAIGIQEPGPYAAWVWEYVRSREAGSAWNTAYYSNPELDKILEEYLSVTDLEKRKELCWQLQEIMNNDLPHYIMFRPDTIEAVRTDKLEGFVGYMGGYSNWINPFTYFNVHAK